MERNKRSVFAGVIGITLLVIIMSVVATTGLDGSCQAQFETDMPIYPDATFVSKDSKFLQYRQAIYHTTAPVQDVKEWYNKTINVAVRESIATGTRENVWDGKWDIEPANQGGSTIILSRTCP